MAQEVGIRPFNRGEEAEIVELLQSVFKGWPHFDLDCSSLDHWRWKYEDNPLKSKVVAVAESDGKIVGCSHGFYLRVKMGPRSLITQQGTDLAILKEFRGKAIYPKLTNLKNGMHKVNGANLTYALSSNPMVIRKDLRENRPHFPSPIKHLIKIYDVGKHFSINPSEDSVIKRYGYSALKRFNQLGSHVDFDRNSLSSRFEVVEAAGIGDEFGEFWDEVKEEYNFIVERDTNFLNWRYQDRRGGRYSVRYVSDQDRILGYLVLRVNRFNEGYPEGYVVDLLTLPNRIDVADALIREAERFFAELGINIVHAMVVTGHPNERLLKRYGFVYDRRKLILFYTPMDVGSELSALTGSPPSKLHFTYGDFDWI